MRRKEREITDNNKIIEIIDKCDCCRLGFKDEESVYIVPLNFGYKKEDEKIIYISMALMKEKSKLNKITI